MFNRYLAPTRISSANRPSILLLSLFLSIGFPGYAQEVSTPDSEPATAAAEAEAPPVLSAADITFRADDVAAKILETQKTVGAVPANVDGVSDALDEFSKDLDELLGPIGPDGFMDMRQADAETLLQTLNRMTQDLDARYELVQQRSEVLDALSRANKTDEDYFRSVLDDDNSDELPDALIERVQSIIEKLGTTRLQIREQLDVMLADLERISNAKLRIAEALQAIEASKQQREREVLSFDRAPIWKMEAAQESLYVRVTREWRARLNGVEQFSKANATGISVSAVLLVVFLGLALYAGRALARRSKQGDIDEVRQPILERPISLAVLLWAILVPEFALPQLPLALGVARLLLIVATLWRMLPVVMPEMRLRSVAGLLGLSVLSGLLEIVQQTDTSDRIVLLFVAGLGAYFFRSLRLKLKYAPNSAKKLWWRLGYALCAIAPTVLIVCMVAVTLGAVALSQEIVDGTLFLFTTLLAVVVVEESLNTAARAFIDGPGARWLRSLRLFPNLAYRRLAIVVRLLMLWLFLNALPRLIPPLRGVYEGLFNALTFEISMGTLSLSIGDVLGVLIGLILAIYAARFIRFTLDEDVFPRLPIATGKAAAASRLIYYALVAAGILVALAAGGIELTKLTLIISALGVGIGFGLQGIVNNFVSGLVLAFERPFQVGDIIAAGTLTGRVREIGLRASRVRTFDGAEVIVPNADLIAGNVINWTLSDRTRRLDIKIGVAYGTDPKRVEELLKKVADDSEVVTKDPEPAVLFQGFGDSSLNFTLRVWIPEAGDWPQLSSDLYMAVHDAIVGAGIVIPFPQRTLHIRKDEL